MTELLHMGWPFAVVCVAAIIGLVVIYGIHRASEPEERVTIGHDPKVARLSDERRRAADED